MADLAAAGVDFDDVTDTLERDGVDSFAASFTDAFGTIEKRRAEVTPDRSFRSGVVRPRISRCCHATTSSASAAAARRCSASSVGGTRALRPLVLGIT